MKALASLPGILRSALALAALSPAWAAGGIHARTEPGGLVVISNVAPAVPDMVEPGTRPRRAAPAIAPASFPRVSGDEQRARDADRRGILQEELAAEQRALDDAQGRGEASDRLRRHQLNIDALQRELMSVR